MLISDRLQVALAKIQQSLPEMKRDGDNVLSSVTTDLLYDENSTMRAGGLLPQIDFIPVLAEKLQTSPETVVKDFEEIRKHCMYRVICWMILPYVTVVTEPSGVRFSVTGNVLAVKEPRTAWGKYFTQVLPVSLSRLLQPQLISASGERVGANNSFGRYPQFNWQESSEKGSPFHSWYEARR